MRKMIAKVLEWYGVYFHHPGQWQVHGFLRKIFCPDVNHDQIVRRAGLLWQLNPANYVESDLFWLGSKDKWEIYHIRKLVKDGSVIFDIGANFGFYACTLAQWLRQKCEVYAFEPFPSNFARLKENVRLNHLEDCVRIRQLGLSDKSEQVTMSVNSRNTGGAQVLRGSGEINLSTVDRVCDEEHIKKLDFIKLDVEGFEVFVLRGGDRVIRRDKPILLVEMNPPTLRRAGVSCELLSETLKQYGYLLYVARRKRLEPMLSCPNGEDYVDVFCIHSSVAGQYGLKVE